MKKVYLEITTWVDVSPDASHCYGTLFVSWDESIELTRKLSARETAALNRLEYGDYDHRPGSAYAGFVDEDSLVKAALKKFAELYSPESTLLILGSHSSSEPALILAGPDDIKAKVNAWYAECERLNWYDGGHRAEVMAITDEFWNYWTGLDK